METKVFKDFDLNKVQAEKKLNKTVSCRVTKEEYDWLKKCNVSPTKLFRYCLMEISKTWKDKKK
ncbi:MAG: hypothetical protein WCX73_00250 [Candidatus Pacearchaeota archaeon]|jgi:hypothetical protein